MVGKLKTKFRKNEGKYVIDYSRIQDKKNIRFKMLSKLNEDKKLVVFIDSSLGKIEAKASEEQLYYLSDEESREKIAAYLSEKQLSHWFRTRKRQERKKIFGFQSGDPVNIEDLLLVVVIEEKGLSQELFNMIMCTYDYSLGINPREDLDQVISDYFDQQSYRIDQSQVFESSLVESHFLMYFYSDIDISI